MDNFVVIAVVAVILGLAVGYIYKAKKRGQKCIGCPDSSACSGSCGGACTGCPGKCKSTQF